MTSPAFQHRIRYEPRHGQTVTLKGDDKPLSAVSPLYQPYFTRLEIDKQTLARIRSLAQRNAKKRELLAGYADYLSTLAPVQQHDEVLSTCLIWLSDAGDWSRLLQLLPLALEGATHAPRGFKGDLAEVLARGLAESSGVESIYFERFAELIRVEQASNIADQVKAKFFKQWAQATEARGDLLTTIDLLKKAQGFGAHINTKLAQLIKKSEGLTYD